MAQQPTFLETFFVSPDCVDDVYEEENMEKWVECASQRGKAMFIYATIVIVVIVVICLIFLGNTGRIIAFAVGAFLIASTFYFTYLGAERVARHQFISSRKELLASGYDPAATYTPAEKLEKRAAAVDKLRRERLKEQEIAAISASRGSAGTAVSAGIGGAIGSFLAKKL